MLILNRHTDEIPPGSVYIMRPGIFGNPYVIGAGTDRDRAIERFKAYFTARVRDDAEFRKAVLGLKDAPALV